MWHMCAVNCIRIFIVMKYQPGHIYLHNNTAVHDSSALTWLLPYADEEDILNALG